MKLHVVKSLPVQNNLVPSTRDTLLVENTRALEENGGQKEGS